MRYATALAWYARGVALAATSRWREAEGALDSVRTIAPTITAQPWGTIASIARESLEGELAARRGDRGAAVAAFERAMRLEDALPYMEPPWWYYPVRHSLARVLLQDGEAARAEKLYREDLARFPENGWSLFGLAQALDAQGKQAEAAAVRARFDESWSNADVRLQGSRF
jgi:tetratricopeptide (TPR) repeat protein